MYRICRICNKDHYHQSNLELNDVQAHAHANVNANVPIFFFLLQLCILLIGKKRIDNYLYQIHSLVNIDQIHLLTSYMVNQILICCGYGNENICLGLESPTVGRILSGSLAP